MGGKAFEGVTQRIVRDEIDPTLDWLEENWLGGRNNPDYLNLRTRLLGSGGKSPTSGDLDLNLDINSYDQAAVARDLVSFLGEDHVKPRPGNNQIFTAVPIRGNPANGYVQVDFMFGDTAWQEFSYFAAPCDPDQAVSIRMRTAAKSSFKGLYRTEMIKALCAFNSDWVLEDNGEVIARVGPTFFHDRGVVWRYRYRPMRKDGQGRVKEFKEVTKEEFLKIYPSAVPASFNLIKDPKVLVGFLIPGRSEADFTTLEGICANLYYNYSVTERQTINKIYLERLNSLKVEIPTKKFRLLDIRC